MTVTDTSRGRARIAEPGEGIGLDLPADLALLGVVAFGLVDGVLRYALLSRRES